MSNERELTHVLYTPRGGSAPARVEERFGEFLNRRACIAFTKDKIFGPERVCDAYADCWRRALPRPRPNERWPRVMRANTEGIRSACASKHPARVIENTPWGDTPAGQRGAQMSAERAADPEGRVDLPAYAAPSWEAGYYGGKTAREMVGLKPGLVFTGVVRPAPGTTVVPRTPRTPKAPTPETAASTAGGPAPLSWGWLVLGAGGLALWYYFAKRRI